MHNNQEFIVESLKAGARGYVLKDCASDELFSSRELEILRMLVNGLSSKQIATQLSISKNTVDTPRRRIFDKVGCNNLANLARYAIRGGYLSVP